LIGVIVFFFFFFIKPEVLDGELDLVEL